MSAQPQTLSVKVTQNGLVVRVGPATTTKAQLATKAATRSFSRKVLKSQGKGNVNDPLWRFQKRGPAIFISDTNPEA